MADLQLPDLFDIPTTNVRGRGAVPGRVTMAIGQVLKFSGTGIHRYNVPYRPENWVER